MAILLSFIVALICGFFLFYEISYALMSYQTRNWKSCVGELVKWDTEVTGPFFEERFSDFRYKYVVSGKEYESKKIGFGFPPSVGITLLWSFQYARRALDEVLANAPMVTVYYSPDNPQNSVLCAGIQGYHVTKIIELGFGVIVFMALAIVQV